MFIDFFTAEDFKSELYMTRTDESSFQRMADIANRKVAKEGLVIHGKYTELSSNTLRGWTVLDGAHDSGILINIKKLVCEHSERRDIRYQDAYGWECLNCKMRVKPTKDSYGWECLNCKMRVKPTKWELFDGKL
jgi:hypothetical protein